MPAAPKIKNKYEAGTNSSIEVTPHAMTPNTPLISGSQ